MQELLQKIEADAASRLKLPAGRQATQELVRFKAFLKLETHRLKMLHRAGGGGLEICGARAAVLDLVLRYLWTAAQSNLGEEERKAAGGMALVAIGGYGRAELNPHSDIDFMFLHRTSSGGRRPGGVLAEIVDGILYPLWDIGLKVGHSVRTLAEAFTEANSDMQSRTSLIEARLVAGDEMLFNRFQKGMLKECVEGQERTYIAQRLEDQATRRAKFGNSACMQEPNIKNGCGGLRDYQNLLWMAFFKYRTRSLRELQAHQLTSEAEHKHLEQAYDFLLRVRTEMHYHANRATDVLSKNLQPAVAHNLGYRDRSPSRRIEEFMRDVYTHSRNIFLITRTLEQRMALLPESGKTAGLSLRALLPRARSRVAEPLDGFKFQDGEIVAVSSRIFREQPRRLMRVFLYAQQRGLRLHPDLAQMIRNQLALVDGAFLTDEHVRDTFLAILSQRGSVGRILRAMHEVDLLGKYVPEFGKLTCLVQHEFYHQYTADEHTLMCLEQLDQVWEAKQAPYNNYAPLFQGLERPFILYLALLLHDVGKPTSRGNHSELSSAMALRAARRMGLDASATQTLRLVIENHLLLAGVSQRRDLDDPAVIRQVAKRVQNPENLALLTIHTFVDSQATSDKLWNGFKDSLLWTLHVKTLRLMTGGAEFVRVEEKQREQLLVETRRLMPAGLSEEELEAHFATLPPRYFQVRSAPEVADDVILAHRFMRLLVEEEEQDALTPVVDWHSDPDRGYCEVNICTWDRAGLFRKIAGSFSATGLNILSSHVFTRTDGIVLDKFFITDAPSGNLAGPEQRERFEQILGKVLGGEEVEFHALIARQKISRPVYQAYTGERLATRIRFENEFSDNRTVVEVEAEDRIGLLYTIAEALAELDLDVVSAKICTERGAAIDTFYVSEPEGGKVVVPERQRQIERHLLQAIAELDKAS